jgi:hypothetical protein
LQADGKMAEGQLDAAGRPDALRQMEALGLRPVNLAEKAAPEKARAKNGAAPAAGKPRQNFSFKFGPKKFRPRNWKISRGCCPACWRRACR